MATPTGHRKRKLPVESLRVQRRSSIGACPCASVRCTAIHAVHRQQHSHHGQRCLVPQGRVQGQGLVGVFDQQRFLVPVGLQQEPDDFHRVVVVAVSVGFGVVVDDFVGYSFSLLQHPRVGLAERRRCCPAASGVDRQVPPLVGLQHGSRGSTATSSALSIGPQQAPDDRQRRAVVAGQVNRQSLCVVVVVVAAGSTRAIHGFVCIHVHQVHVCHGYRSLQTLDRIGRYQQQVSFLEGRRWFFVAVLPDVFHQFFQALSELEALLPK
mmetsp:Transcript_16746/g.36532  ORF Transcript_16746/g.36532 Transcript_16746/m.36532 type:complete len:267 (-) Transcript_16746:156-956(-)